MRKRFILPLLVVFCFVALTFVVSAQDVSNSTNEISVSAIIDVLSNNGIGVDFIEPYGNTYPGRVTFTPPESGTWSNVWLSSSMTIKDLIPNYEPGGTYWFWNNGNAISIGFGVYIPTVVISAMGNGTGVVIDVPEDTPVHIKLYHTGLMYINYPVIIKSTESIYNNIWGLAQYPRPYDYDKGFLYFYHGTMNAFTFASWQVNFTARQNAGYIEYNLPAKVVVTPGSVFVYNDYILQEDGFHYGAYDYVNFVGTFDKPYRYIYNDHKVSISQYLGTGGAVQFTLISPFDDSTVIVSAFTSDFVHWDIEEQYHNYLVSKIWVHASITENGISIYDDGSSYTNGYEVGLSDGYKNGYEDGTNQNQSVVYNEAYHKGFIEGTANASVVGGNTTFMGLMTSVVRAPVTVLMSLLDVDILGMNMRNLFFLLIALAVLIISFKFILKIF